MRKTITTLLLTLGTASAMPSPLMARQNNPAPGSHKLIIGAPFQILTADFDGTKFSITGNHTASGKAPSWLLYREPNLVYAVNENADDLGVFALDSSLSNPTLKSSGSGSAGVVFLEFDANKTRMVGAAYGSGKIDVWDTTATDGSVKLIKSITIEGEPNPAQGAHHPHQALLDPTGRFFVIPNLGGDTLLVLDTKDDKYEITSYVTLPTGTGPRHGGFITDGESHYYALASELSNDLFLFAVTYPDQNIAFEQIQKQSTYGANPPANATSAAAGELIVSAPVPLDTNDNKNKTLTTQKHVYVSNRISGNATDSIAHFLFKSGPPRLDFAESVSTAGLRPRMFSLSTDKQQTLAFVANQGGDAGLAAFKRNPDSGALDPTPVATVPSSALVAPELAATEYMGPQFVQEI
ncbi:putative isomerase YbhE [Hypoxylon sp. FL1857]|nr:putative isomerase YbhE [Hypoxylon sp. FL1857]